MLVSWAVVEKSQGVARKELAQKQSLTCYSYKAVALKNKGNKYFKGGRYSQAVKCYSDAIDNCPKDSKSDLSTFYQNRAAAHEQMVWTFETNQHIFNLNTLAEKWSI